MPVRSERQKSGRRGEQLVDALFDAHPNWVSRAQNVDFGIDLEVELAAPNDEGQSLLGRILKIQVKTQRRLRFSDTHVMISVTREWIDYTRAFRVPVILVVVDLESERCWWLWMQEWALLNEQQLAGNMSISLTVRIPFEQQLDEGALRSELPGIAEGRPPSAMVLALRGILEVAHGWANAEIARGIVELLGRTQFPSREWTIQKVVDELVGFGPHLPYWQAQQLLPILLALVRSGGYALQCEHVIRIVKRGDTYSRVGLNALEAFYDRWPDHAASLKLPCAFTKVGLAPVAWYVAMREHFPRESPFVLFIARQPDGDLNYGGLTLRLDESVRDYLQRKWPTRGDSALLDCLFATDPNSEDNV